MCGLVTLVVKIRGTPRRERAAIGGGVITAVQAGEPTVPAARSQCGIEADSESTLGRGRMPLLAVKRTGYGRQPLFGLYNITVALVLTTLTL